MADLKAKRDKLFTEIESTLNAHRSNVQGQKHFRGLNQTRASRKARLDIMGDPKGKIWYFHVFHLGQNVLQEAPDGTAQRVRHDFNVQVLYEWSDDEDFVSSSQDTWETIMHNTGTPKGLVEYLNDSTYVQADGDTTTILPPEPLGEDMFDITNLDSDGREWAHIAEMRVPMLDPRA